MALTSRMVLNRKAFAEVELAEVDGMFAVAERVLEVARVPDAPPHGRGLIEGGGAIAYAGRKKVNGTLIGGRSIKKPRDARLDPSGLTVIVGFGFPARFVELGTIDTPAEPFLTPAVAAVVPNAEVIVSAATRRRLAGQRDARAAARFGAGADE